MPELEIHDGDVIIECSDCGEQFVHTAGEQAFMREKFGENYAPPKRCKVCRRKRKELKNDGQNN